MTRKNKTRSKRHEEKIIRVQPPNLFSQITNFFRRHSIITVISGMVALMGSLASIYALSEPTLVAIRPNKTFNGQLQAEPGGGLAIWMEIEQRFKNDSWRGGGHVSGIQMVPHSLDTATWLNDKIIPSNSEIFTAYEERTVKSNALFKFPQLVAGKKYPQFAVDIQFLDQKGAVIKEYGKDTPYSLQFTITESALNSLKSISDPIIQHSP